jgi:hypothetical protein
VAKPERAAIANPESVSSKLMQPNAVFLKEMAPAQFFGPQGNSEFASGRLLNRKQEHAIQ